MNSSARMDKYQVINEVLRKNESVSAVARKFGIARKTIYAWLKRYQAASPRIKKQILLAGSYKKGAGHPREYRHQFKNRLVRLISHQPKLSLNEIASRLKAGRHAVYNLLRDLQLEKPEDRLALARLYVGPGRLDGRIKQAGVRDVLEQRKSISAVSRESQVARKTIYQWIKRYQTSGNLAEGYVCGSDHPRAYSQTQVDTIMDGVIVAPELSIHHLAKACSLSGHGVFNVLQKQGLTHQAARIAFAEAQRTLPQPVLGRGLLRRIKSVWETFVPSLAPAPPPSPAEVPTQAGFSIFNLLKFFSASVFISSIVGYGFLYYVDIFAHSASFSQGIGFFFATVALLMGSFFFLYSLKYYLTLIIVLSYSQRESGNELGNSNQETVNSQGKIKGLLGWILGLKPGEFKPGGGSAI